MPPLEEQTSHLIPGPVRASDLRIDSIGLPPSAGAPVASAHESIDFQSWNRGVQEGP